MVVIGVVTAVEVVIGYYNDGGCDRGFDGGGSGCCYSAGGCDRSGESGMGVAKGEN